MTDPIEAMCRAHAKADGLDWDEVCGLEADPLGECDSGTCIAACYEDHDAGYARAVCRQQATAAYAALRETLVPVGWQRRWLFPLESDPPGKIFLWEACSRSEATDMFKREGGCEYRPIYALPEIKP